MNTFKSRLRFILDTMFHGNYSEMGRELNVTHTSIKNYIDDDKNRLPKYDFIFRICTKLDINPNWLILGIGEISLNKSNPTSTTYFNLGTGENATQIINNNDDSKYIMLQMENLKEKNNALMRENELLREMNNILKNSHIDTK